MNKFSSHENLSEKDESHILDEAVIRLQNGQLIKAQKLYRELLGRNPENISAIYGIAWIANLKKDLASAEALFRQVIDLSPDHARAHYNLGTLLLKKGELAAAQNHFESAISNDSDFPEAFANIGFIRMQRGDLDEARHCFEKAAKLAPENLEVLVNLGQCLFHQRYYDSAELVFRRALKINPKSISLLYYISKIKIHMGKFHDGEKILQAAIALEPQNDDIYLKLGRLFEKTKMRKDALNAYKSAIKINPNSIDAICCLSHFTQKELGVDLLPSINVASKNLDSELTRDKIRLRFAKARVLHELRQWPNAWREMVEANNEIRNYFRIKPTAKRSFSRDYKLGSDSGRDQISLGAGPALLQTKFVIITGMPRAGKSTAEQLMKNFSGVKCGYESQIIFEAMHELTERNMGSLNKFDNFNHVTLASECQSIFERRLSNRHNNCSVYTLTTNNLDILDQMPNIMTLMPNVLVVFIDRDDWDNTLKIFMSDYGRGAANYAYSISATLQNIRLFRSAADWWSKNEPKRCVKIKYEDIVDNPRNALTKLGLFCGLSVPRIEIEAPTNDRGCSKPYQAVMETFLEEEEGLA